MKFQNLPPENQIGFYQKMLTIRFCEEALIEEYPRDQIKTPIHLSIGEEAISVGVMNALPFADCFGTYRSHGLYIERTGDIEGFFSELYGQKEGINGGIAGSMHLSNPKKGVISTSAIVSSTIPLAVGAALANQIKGQNQKWVISFFGDGAVEEGVFWESLNFAKLKNLNILFVCEDNDLAIHAKPEIRQGFKSIQDIPKIFDIPFESCQGWNLDEVWNSTKNLFSCASANGPKFLHCKYHRFLEHVGINEDFDAGYRNKPKNDKNFDPIENFEKNLMELKFDREKIEEIKTLTRQKILKIKNKVRDRNE